MLKMVAAAYFGYSLADGQNVSGGDGVTEVRKRDSV